MGVVPCSAAGRPAHYSGLPGGQPSGLGAPAPYPPWPRVSRGRYLSEGRPMSGKDFGPAQAPVRIAYGDDAERRRGAPSAQGSDALDEVLAVRAAQVGRAALEVVDVGAGTGGFAVRLAKLGHHVTVVDPSPDAPPPARRRGGAARAPPALAVLARPPPPREGPPPRAPGAGRHGRRAPRQRGRGGAAARAGRPVRR